MDIRSIETSAKRVLAYVTSVQESPSKLYKPSKLRLQKIRELCLECAEIIAEVTEMADDSNISHEPESSHEDLLNQIRSLVEVASWSAVEHHIERQTSVTSDMKPAESSDAHVAESSADKEVSKSDKTKITKSDRKHAISTYATVLKAGAEPSDKESPSDADRCASLVWLWFSSRFLESKNPNFHYDVASIPEFIKSLVIAFSIHRQHGTLKRFLSEVHKWCRDICTDHRLVWALPYTVNEIYKNGVAQLDHDTTMLWFDLYCKRWSGLDADTKLKWPLGMLTTRCSASA